ncbi:hypothetical protein AB0B12_02230 [Streptomyces sp. NPDC044780]|uniref:hypothetical protein n=1 Tax=unclassified Streptomyces TaxID=2593676 RepID=UPI0033C63A18
MADVGGRGRAVRVGEGYEDAVDVEVFPACIEAAPLTALEIEALRALHVTLQDLRHEYESALAVTHRSYRLEQNAEVWARPL